MCILLILPLILAFQTDDLNTYANIDEFIITHYEPTLYCDFTQKQFTGSILLKLKSISVIPSKTIYLDVQDITINSIKHGGSTLKYSIDNPDSIEYGKRLCIKLDSVPTVNQEIDLNINFATKKGGSDGVTWLDASYTAGKKYPYVFTQCQSVYARSLIPCQDTPFIKSTFQVNLQIPKPMTGFASGLLLSSSDKGNYTEYTYSQAIPVPSYLFAVTAGDIAVKSTSYRTNIMTESSMMDKCVWELSDANLFVSTIEKLYIPYLWGQYNILILPPSFPFGGMENPQMTYASPSIVIGDKSEEAVIAHEIMHSWTGNLITCKNWTHFWINEGFTVYGERKTLEKVYGMSESVIAAYLGYSDLKSFVNGLPKGSEMSIMLPDIKRKSNPDDYFSIVPYEKGFFLLKYLASLIGDDAMDDYIRIFISSYAYHTVDSYEMKALFHKFVNLRFSNASSILSKIDWDTWFYSTGMPPYVMGFDGVITEPDILSPLSLSNQFILQNGNAPDNWNDYNMYTAKMKIVFMDNLWMSVNKMNLQIVDKLEMLYTICEKEVNFEILKPWYSIIATLNLSSYFTRMDEYLGRTGRLRYIEIVYEQLAKSNKVEAITLYNNHKTFYDPLAQKVIQGIIGITGRVHSKYS